MPGLSKINAAIAYTLAYKLRHAVHRENLGQMP